MKLTEITKNDFRLFTVFASLWIFTGWIGWLLAIGGFFYLWIFSGVFLIFSATLLRSFFRKKISLKISSEFALILSSVALFVVVSSFFVSPTVFSGRDQGSISEGAVRLSQNHQLEFSNSASKEFFKIYGTGKALNFPGFYYTQEGNLTTHFPIAYISWLAMFFSVFGLYGLVAANGVLLFFSLVSFYLASRIFLRAKESAMLLSLVAVAFPIFWFFKFTLSENLALALVWISILELLLFLKEKRLLYYFSFLISAGLLVFTRIEGIFFLLAGMVVLFFQGKQEIFKENKKKTLLYPGIALSVFLLINFSKSFYFYQEIAKAIFNFGEKTEEKTAIFASFLSPLFFQGKIFLIYSILGIILLGIFGIIYFFRKKDWFLLVPFVFVAPSFIYLFSPWISSDHPWMLRRFAFSIFPALLFYAFIFLFRWDEKQKFIPRKILFNFVFFAFLISNLTVFWQFFPFSENKNLLEETQKISREFESNDLVLVDRLASGSGWSMLNGPMSFLDGKNAVYFFNPYDFDKIDRKVFSKIYLVVSNENIQTYSEFFSPSEMEFVRNYSLETERIFTYGNKKVFPLILPEKQTIKVQGKIFKLKGR